MYILYNKINQSEGFSDAESILYRTKARMFLSPGKEEI